MAKVTIIPAQQSNAEFEPRNFTQVGGIYGAEIRPEDFLVYADISPYLPVQNEELVNPEREPRFFRVR